MKNEIVLFETEDHEIRLNVRTDRETVWLSQAQMTDLFGVDRTVITRHVNNVFKEGEVTRESNVQKMHIANSDRLVSFYSLDVIISVGYRVKSNRGVEFRKWANNVLKRYIIQGYAANERLLAARGKTIELQSRIIAGSFEGEETEVLRAVNAYTDALTLLDNYDHQVLSKPDGIKPVYRITYEECRNMIDHMEYSGKSDVFGVEKEKGKVKGILEAVYQNVFGQELYPTLEEKAANLLYFMIKDHPFTDGCKRIAASLFLEFLQRNRVLYKDGLKRISDSALVAITLMIAESKPEEKEVMTTLVMNFLA